MNVQNQVAGDPASDAIWRKPGFRWKAGGILILLLLGYWPALNGGFIMDDNDWITSQTGLLDSPSGIMAMWLHPSLLPQYYPLTATSFAMDYQLWGTWTLPYHLENVLLHFAAALLLWELLTRLRIPGAWLAAAIFVIHPAMVQSVAWITERKNVLSIVFFLGALLVYDQYLKVISQPDAQAAGGNAKGDARRDGPPPSVLYMIVFFLFFAALLAKTAVFPLPAVILLIQWWKTGRVRWREDVVPVLRLFILAVVLCAITFWLERNNAGAKGADFIMTPAERLLIAGHAFWFYLGNLFWPVNLCFIYPQWQVSVRSVWQWLYPVTAAGLLIALLAFRGRIGRGPVTVFFYYVGTLFPVLGFLNVFAMRYTYVWDHWAYLSDIGIITLVAALVVRLAEHLGRPAMVYWFAGIVLPILTLLTWHHAATFADARTAWERTLKLNPDCVLAQVNLGTLDSQQGNNEAAAGHFRRAIEIMPDFYEARYDYGLFLADQGHFDEAITNYRAALASYREAAALHPVFAAVYNNLGFALAQEKKDEEAISNFHEALRLVPDFSKAHQNLGLVLFNMGRFPEAIDELGEAARLNPGYQGDLNLATSLLDENNEAWTLATSPDPAARNGQQAVELSEQACKTSGFQQPMLMGTLAAAYAEAGRFDDAVRTADKACELGAALGDTNLVQRNQELIRLYKAHQAYHESAGAGPTKD